MSTPGLSEMFAYHATTMANTIRTSLIVFTRMVRCCLAQNRECGLGSAERGLRASAWRRETCPPFSATIGPTAPSFASQRTRQCSVAWPCTMESQPSACALGRLQTTRSRGAGSVPLLSAYLMDVSRAELNPACMQGHLGAEAARICQGWTAGCDCSERTAAYLALFIHPHHSGQLLAY